MMEFDRLDHRRERRDRGRDRREWCLEERRYHKVSEGVWKTLQRTLVLEEEEADQWSFLEEEEEVFLTPPESPRDASDGDDPRLHDTVLRESNATKRRYTPSRAQRMLTLHDTIVRDLTHPEAVRLSASALDTPRMEGPRRLVISYFPGCDGKPGSTIKYPPPCHGRDANYEGCNFN